MIGEEGWRSHLGRLVGRHESPWVVNGHWSVACEVLRRMVPKWVVGSVRVVHHHLGRMIHVVVRMVTAMAVRVIYSLINSLC